ncbi:glycine betaine ABC transporter glycine betaine-binding protein [Tetragenococcus halophilus subsp. flandriensis]|nr:glycine betaine ABC transporter glycine betaine-binding protein [Tetragenococcus halophilus subsp. flandriensis]
MKKKLVGMLALSSTLLLAACSNGGGDNDAEGGGNGGGDTVELSYVEWDTEVASTNVVAQVLEDMGYNVNITPLDNAVMWEAVANGESDGMVAGWLPVTHEAQYEEFGDQVEDLGPNLPDAAQLGLVVPEYMDVDSIEDLDDQVPEQEIIGIEPGAGVVAAAEETVETYDNLSDWEVTPSSSGAMTSQLGSAIQNEDPIVITGWSPHWMFERYDLKYLDDPEGTMGGAESIHTMVREGLEDDMPEVYSILDNFEWTEEDINTVMLDIEDGEDPEDAARDWIEDNQDKVDEWTADAE